MNQSSSPPRIIDFVTRKAATSPGNSAILSPSRCLSYEELALYSENISNSLLQLGLSNGRRVGVALPNGLEMLLVFFGITEVATFVPLNPVSPPEEFSKALRGTRVDVLLTLENLSNVIQAANEAFIPVLVLESSVSVGWSIRPLGPVNILPTLGGRDEIAVVLQTTGTTSTPKVVPLTHRNLCVMAEHYVRFLAMTEEDRCINVIPLFHVYGILTPVMTSIAAGGSIVCLDSFEVAAFFRLLDEFSPNWYAAGPAIHHEVARYAESVWKGRLPQAFRRIQSGGAPIPAKLVDRLKSIFHAPILQGYGLTETSAMGTCNPIGANKTWQGSVGIPVGGEVRIADQSGRSVANGDFGQILLRGPGLMSGYELDEAANREAFREGWFITGDQGYFDSEGYLFITGRDRDVINRGGQKIYPKEVEDGLMAHPGVAEVTVFPIPHPTLGEAVAAAFVPAAGDCCPSELDLRLELSRHMTAYKVPQRILQVTSIPKGSTGKVKRNALAGVFQKELEVEAIADSPILGGLDPNLEAERTERVLREHPQIVHCAVLPWSTRNRGLHLVSFIVERKQELLETSRDRLFPSASFSVKRQKMPMKSYLDWLLRSGADCIVPEAQVVLTSIPLTVDKQIDRQQLAALPLRLRVNPLPVEISEIMLAEICKAILGLESIGMQDDFFALGGDSLKVVSLLHEIERVFGRSVSPEVMFRQPTLAGLLHVLKQAASEGMEGSMVNIQAGASSVPPFFFLHGDYNGGGFHCLRLARLLGAEQGLVTFIPHGLPGQPLPTSIETMADQYLPLMIKRQPVGPYRLGGHCNGALVALEMAQRLTAEGEDVERLILISPPVLNVHLSSAICKDRQAGTSSERIFWHQPVMVRKIILNELYRRAVLQYTPRRYEGGVTLLLTQSDILHARKSSLPWVVQLPRAQTLLIPGDHLDVFTKYLPSLSRILRRCLDGDDTDKFCNHNGPNP
jgi:acyl-CoA synthetase (AMP-forming)/AMP-acid ligase II/pimeloyl-ACP methyl ester carboxylesterase